MIDFLTDKCLFCHGFHFFYNYNFSNSTFGRKDEQMRWFIKLKSTLFLIILYTWFINLVVGVPQIKVCLSKKCKFDFVQITQSKIKTVEVKMIWKFSKVEN